MVGATVDAEIAELPAAERSSWQHPLNGLLHHALGKLAGEDLLRGSLLDAADIAGVVMVDLLLRLSSGQNHLVRIDHNDIVAAIDMWCKNRAMLAAQAQRNQRGEATDDEPLRVDEHPFLFDLADFGRVSGHGIHFWVGSLDWFAEPRPPMAALLYDRPAAVNAENKYFAVKKQRLDFLVL